MIWKNNILCAKHQKALFCPPSAQFLLMSMTLEQLSAHSSYNANDAMTFLHSSTFRSHIMSQWIEVFISMGEGDVQAKGC